MSGNARRGIVLLVTLAAVLTVALAPFMGAQSISPAVLWSEANQLDRRILTEIRLPRVLLAFIAGAGLAVSGLVYQAVFRNFLACPFTLGVSSGAALGAALAMKLDLQGSLAGVPAVALLALSGALLTVFLVVSLAGRGAPAVMVLLAGLVVSFICSSLIVLTQFLLDVGEVFSLTRWLMGGLAVVGMDVLWQVLPFVVAGLCYALYFRHELLLLSLGEELAWGRGLDVARARNRHLIVSSAMVGAIVSLCGPIGFVGIMVPHACRLRLGVAPIGLTLLVVAAVGGTFLTVSDTVARTAIAPYELPVGVITALLGGPYFLLLLFSRQREAALR